MASDFVRNIKDVRNIDILSRNTVTENDLISTTDGEVYVVTKKGYRKITNIETKDFEALKKQADTNTLNISDLTDDINTLNTTTETNTSDIESLKTSTDTNTSDISNLKTTTETNTNDIGTLQTDTNNNTSEIETLKTDVNNNTSEIETLQTDTNNNTSEIETLKTNVNNNTSEIGTTQTLAEELQTQLNDLKSKTKQYYTLFEGNANGVGSTIQLNDDLRSYDLIYVTCDFPGGVFTETVLVKTLIENIPIQRINLRDSDGTFLGCYEVLLTLQDNNILEITNDVSWDELGSTGTGQDRNAYTILNIEGVK